MKGRGEKEEKGEETSRKQFKFSQVITGVRSSSDRVGTACLKRKRKFGIALMVSGTENKLERYGKIAL